MTADKIQHGGTHYAAEYQHWNLVADLGLDYFAANATKYITRHRKKNGRLDVQKAIHYAEKKIELIKEGRIPAPYEYHMVINMARNELVLRFADANGIDPESEEFTFLQEVCLAQEVDSLHQAVLAAKVILRRYDMPLGNPLAPPSSIAAAFTPTVRTFEPVGVFDTGEATPAYVDQARDGGES